MKKPYIKKIGDASGFKVWYVNGYWIRKHLSRSFPNYGSNEIFAFIPKNELWIDKENSSKEAKYIIINFLAYQKELSKGKNKKEAIRLATNIEKKERHKSRFSKKLKKIKLKEKIIKKIHKKILFKKYTKNIRIWIARGKIVRSFFDVDFNQGGHDLIYQFIPRGEIWIDDYLYKKEIPFILVHELHERRLMAEGRKYDSVGITKTLRLKGDNKIYAHPAAEDLEYFCRHHSKQIMKILKREINLNEKLLKKNEL